MASSWSVAVDPNTPQTSNVHWTISLSAPYCGGYQIGDGVFIEAEAPLAFPDPAPADAVLFAGEPAQVSQTNGVLQVSPAASLARSMICMQGDRPFTIELLPSLGLSNPDPGSYAIDVWVGSGSQPVQLPVTIDDPAPSAED
ncbi:MAG TPA: hypothetical protein VF937_00145 [Chloroflexota bacterium]